MPLSSPGNEFLCNSLHCRFFHRVCDQTKRTLASTERKYDEAAKAREALERLKAHCESLQESLDLSEKIRVRQKKLLHQLQLNQHQHQEQPPVRTKLSTPPPIKRTTGRASAAKLAVRETATTTNETLSGMRHNAKYASADDDIVHTYHNTSRQRRDNDNDNNDILDALVNRHVASVAATQSPTPNAHVAYTYADFDRLLQKVHSPHPYTTREAPPVAFNNKPHQPNGRILRRPTSATSSRPRAKSQGPPATRSRGSSSSVWAPAAAAPHHSKQRTNHHFLAPTQASLQRVQARRPDEPRRPFI